MLRVLQIFVEHTMEYVFEVTKKIAMRMYKVNIIIITGKFNPAYICFICVFYMSHTQTLNLIPCNALTTYIRSYTMHIFI